MNTDKDITPIPGAAFQVWAGWIWINDGLELSWSKRRTRAECEHVVYETCQRLGIETALAD
jgi:hypothetical protein